MNVWTVSIASICLLTLVTAGPAHGQNSGNHAVAEQLFKQGIELMKQGKFADACPKLEASHKADPTPGARLNLARCYENIGRLASAWSHYRAVVELDTRSGRQDRAAFAQGRADALEPTIPRLLIEVPKSARVPGLTVTRNEEPVDAALFGVAIYVDAGTHTIVASAPGHASMTREVELAAEQTVTVEIPDLDPKAPSTDPAPTRSPSANDRASGSPLPVNGDSVTVPRSSAKTRRTLGLLLTSAGLAVGASALGLSWSAKSSWEQAFDDGSCERATLLCNAEGQARTDTAVSRANIATILGAAGGALAITGAVLYFTGRTRDAPQRSVHVAPAAGLRQIGIWVNGRF